MRALKVLPDMLRGFRQKIFLNEYNDCCSRLFHVLVWRRFFFLKLDIFSRVTLWKMVVTKYRQSKRGLRVALLRTFCYCGVVYATARD